MTRADWDKFLAENPGDQTLRLAFADWLDDAGELTRAEAVRFLLREGKRPRPSLGPDSIHCWWSHDVWPTTSWDPEDLPQALFECLPGFDPRETPQRIRYDSFQQAEAALIEAYVRWRETGPPS